MLDGLSFDKAVDVVFWSLPSLMTFFEHAAEGQNCHWYYSPNKGYSLC